VRLVSECVRALHPGTPRPYERRLALSIPRSHRLHRADTCSYTGGSNCVTASGSPTPNCIFFSDKLLCAACGYGTYLSPTGGCGASRPSTVVCPCACRASLKARVCRANAGSGFRVGCRLHYALNIIRCCVQRRQGGQLTLHPFAHPGHCLLLATSLPSCRRAHAAPQSPARRPSARSARPPPARPATLATTCPAAPAVRGAARYALEAVCGMPGPFYLACWARTPLYPRPSHVPCAPLPRHEQSRAAQPARTPAAVRAWRARPAAALAPRRPPARPARAASRFRAPLAVRMQGDFRILGERGASSCR
jgi:hypothetical protein